MSKIKSRLYCPKVDLTIGNSFTLDPKQQHYVRNVMRAQKSDFLGIFNGHDGEYACEIQICDKKAVIVTVINQIRVHLPPTNLKLIFALIKKNPLEYLVQKATELGVGVLQPILTERTTMREINHARLETIVIEAAEQCCLTAIPTINAPILLKEAVSNNDHILFCDERGEGKKISDVISEMPIKSILIGPEGGFSPPEAAYLYDQPHCIPVSLGPRIMRAETAAIASLAVAQLI